MIKVSRDVWIDERDIELIFFRNTGPGGQNVNKVATAVQLRYHLDDNHSLPDSVLNRLRHMAGRKISGTGALLIEARRYRTQTQNRCDAMTRLIKMVRKATRLPKKRIATIPSKNSREKRLASKRKRGQIKKSRSGILDDGRD